MTTDETMSTMVRKAASRQLPKEAPMCQGNDQPSDPGDQADAGAGQDETRLDPLALVEVPQPPPPIAAYDLHTVARGVQECNSQILQGWRVYGFWIVEEIRRRGGPQRGEIRQPMPYYFMGRTLTEEESAMRARLSQEAASVAADAIPPTPAPAPSPDGDSGQDESSEPEPKPAPARRRGRQKAVGGRTVRPQGGLGPMQTTALRDR